MRTLNASEMINAFVVDVPKEHVSASPLHLQLHWQGQNSLHQGRVLFRLEEKAELTVIEEVEAHSLHENCFGNFLWIAELAPGAKLQWIRLQKNHRQNWINTDLQVYPQQSSEFQLFDLQLGGSWGRHRTHIHGQGPKVKTHLLSLALLDQKDCSFRESIVEYSHPECESEQIVKTLIGGESKSIFQGSILLHREAQKSNTNQLSQTLALSKNAESISEPLLEIQADDVKAGHGSAFGSLNTEEEFYLQSRGLSKNASQQLLIAGFTHEFLMKLPKHIEGTAFASKTKISLDKKLKEMANALPFAL